MSRPTFYPDPCIYQVSMAGGLHFDPESCRTSLRTAWKAIPAISASSRAICIRPLCTLDPLGHAAARNLLLAGSP